MAHIDSELRHMTSAGHLARSPKRAIQRLGSPSPNSIPSSPTSVHSSSSAIFERDIEPIVPPSPPFLGQNPHRIPRAKGTEHLEHAVPSVLDSAASILAGIDESPEANANPLDHIAVVAPAAASSSPVAFDSILARSPNSGFASPIGSFRSRSPSPLGLRVATGVPGGVASIPILNIPPSMSTGNGPSPSHSATSSPPAQGFSPLPRPTNIGGTPLTPNSVIAPPPPPPLPAIVTPTSVHVESSESSPTTETACEHSASSATSPQSGTSAIISIPAPGAHSGAATSAQPTSTSMTSHPHPVASPTSSLPLNLSHPPSPTHGPTKRLSFMSYSDLLTSTPASTLPLSSLTTSASTMEPPPHIPALAAVTGSPVAPGLLSPGSPSIGGGGGPSSGIGRPRVTSSTGTSLRGFALQGGKRDSMVMMDDVGGEWEREGLGRGLEERLEALIAVVPPTHHQAHTPPQQQVVVTRT